jgi:hypothetical protein
MSLGMLSNSSLMTRPFCRYRVLSGIAVRPPANTHCCINTMSRLLARDPLQKMKRVSPASRRILRDVPGALFCLLVVREAEGSGVCAVWRGSRVFLQHVEPPKLHHPMESRGARRDAMISSVGDLALCHRDLPAEIEEPPVTLAHGAGRLVAAMTRTTFHPCSRLGCFVICWFVSIRTREDVQDSATQLVKQWLGRDDELTLSHHHSSYLGNCWPAYPTNWSRT